MSPVATSSAELDTFAECPVALRLHGGVQHYAWGTTDFIPSLLGIDNERGRPFAELWMGAHPDRPSTVELGGQRVSLAALIEARPEAVIGPRDAARYDHELPYLFKVLSAAVPLSIQAHPARDQAEAGFEREEAAGIPSGAAARNYKDRNHKPEVLVALTEFHALHGFRPLEEIARLAAEVPELAPALAVFSPSGDGLRNLYAHLMRLPRAEVDALLSPLVSRLAAEHAAEPFTPSAREYWLLEADRHFSTETHHDRGLFSIYLLNLMTLQPGEAIFLPAGNLHAYLRGTGMELMANSNNVLRGGLTSKHVDVDELLRVIAFEGGEPEVIRPVSLDGAAAVYATPAEEFEISRLDVRAGSAFEAPQDHGVDILIVTDKAGEEPVGLDHPGGALSLGRGDCALVPAGIRYRVHSPAPATLYRATVPA